MPNWFVKAFATAGVGSVVGTIVGVIAWNAGKERCGDLLVEGCIERLDLLGLTFTSFGDAFVWFGAAGGFIGFVVMVMRNIGPPSG